ncbi:MAG: proline--tRNA ligase [Gemmatimonadetes bacterium]|nr:proline--tRNA ligase [Gemmatimonadota bacterium]
MSEGTARASAEKALTPRAQDFSAWYNEVVLRAELADYSPVRGSMVIRPWGYAIWEHMQQALDRMFKDTGHQNAYFPLFIPMSFIEREKEHIEGFAPELAVVTHAGGKKLEEPLVVRPTSETVIYAMFARWVQSYRDLPLLINQWANVVRWELRTRLFLRTAEFLWQEGHTAHATEEEAQEETRRMLGVYRRFMEEWLAIPPLTGLKTESERFAGAVRTYACEALVQDNRALQAGTSHNLGQNFSRQFDLKFQSQEGREEYAWNTSWGVSTRLVGAMVMAHGDDAGIVVPPLLAPVQVVIVPIWRDEGQKAAVLDKTHEVARALRRKARVKVDDREHLSPGAKFYEWEAKGVPLRVEIGPKDLAKQQVVLVPRVTMGGAPRKESLKEVVAVQQIPDRLAALQRALLAAALRRREENSHRGVRDLARFHEIVDGPGGFVYTGWCGSTECELKAKEETKATIRVIPDIEFRSKDAPQACVVCGEPAATEVVWAKAY